MKYLKVFENESNYTSYKNSEDYITPNVSMIKATGGVRMKAYVPPPVLVGDVAYWDGSKVKTTPLSSWNTSLGTPVGVVVIPTGFAPDGKTRIVSLKTVDSSGNASTSHTFMKWGVYNTDTSLTNYAGVPITDNAGSTSTGFDYTGYLPSDTLYSFTGTTSYVDSKVKYYYDDYYCYIPSPYLGDEPNPEYYKTISGNNTLSDFNGLSNTQTLVGLGTDYTAANAAWKYNDGASNLQWYLPGMGELGYILPRLNVINNTITTLRGFAVGGDYAFWSSTEYFSKSAYVLDTNDGWVYPTYKDSDNYVRPFSIL